MVVVIAGPNGSGKSTTAPSILRDALAVPEFVNADTIALGLSALRPESVALAAGRVMLTRLRTLAAAGGSFAFETTLAGRNFASWLRSMQGRGFRVHLAFLSLPDADLAVARVAERVRQGGHHVPEDVIRRRFVAGLSNFFSLYEPLCDSWQMFDNADVAGPRMIAAGGHGTPKAIFDEDAWRHLEEVAR